MFGKNNEHNATRKSSDLSISHTCELGRRINYLSDSRSLLQRRDRWLHACAYTASFPNVNDDASNWVRGNTQRYCYFFPWGEISCVCEISFFFSFFFLFYALLGTILTVEYFRALLTRLVCFVWKHEGNNQCV